MSTTKPTIKQTAELIISLTTAIIRARGNPEIVASLMSADNPLEELLQICATNDIRFVYVGDDGK